MRMARIGSFLGLTLAWGLALAALSTPLHAQTAAPALQVDLNGDRQLETISLAPTATKEQETFYELQIHDAKGQLVGRGPQVSDRRQPQVLGSFPWGASQLQSAADVDGDGYLEIVIATPKTDVRPTTFSLWNWVPQEKKVKFKRLAAWMTTNPNPKAASDPELYLTTSKLPDRYDPQAWWVESFAPPAQQKATLLQASIIHYLQGQGPTSREAQLAPSPQGLEFVRWLP